MTKCHDCPVPIPNGMQHVRSIRLQRVVLCSPCAEDRGWIDSGPVEAARFIAEAELYANHARR